MNKSLVRDAIVSELRAELARQTAAAQLARDEAISEESRAENKYDTHSQEAAYLAEGQARLAAEIASNVSLYTSLPLPDFSAEAPIAVSALVKVELRGRPTWYFIGPRAGGLEVNVGDTSILVLTPQSPLGRQLIGKRVGDTAAAPGGGGSLRIVAVS